MKEIRRLTKFAKEYEDVFAQFVMGFSLKASEAERGQKQAALYKKNARIREIDGLFERLYEDNVSGKVSDERYARMSGRYEVEQRELAEDVRALGVELANETDRAVTAEDFLATVRKYTRAKKLTPALLNELIECIEVYHAENVDGKKTQRLRIHYRCIGEVQVPDVVNLPNAEVELGTRKGVSVSYLQSSTETQKTT